uniref:Galactokinase n=1 Tax=Syphacia muris TaxID=451379 RepID=A0A0N5AA68_9BILA
MENLYPIFAKHFSKNPQFIVRCPGRVNLIGEHIDYSGYGVFPMAVSVSTYVLVSWNDSDKIHFINTDPAFPDSVHNVNDEWIGKPIKWYHYFLCGWKGILEELNLKPKGFNVLVSGQIPVSSGLSSSSSLVCAAALATLYLYTGKTFDIISKTNLADLCAKIERYIGTEGGGMDQAIEILAKANCAMRIDFNPLRFEEVSLPDSALFAVVHSGSTMNKSTTSNYNQRVIECRIATKLIAKLNGYTNWKTINTLKQAADSLQMDVSQMTDVVEKCLKQPVYSRNDVLRILEISDEELRQSILSANTLEAAEFKLKQRALHVYNEADRVIQFGKYCKDGNIEEMGRLMNESHKSCRDLYECSCEELDKTVQKCLDNGAIGARLTGAGWGGCVVALFKQQNSDLPVLFWTRPCSGIEVINC